MNYGRRIGEDDGDGIEANLVPIETSSSRIAAGGADNTFLFVIVDSALGAAEFGREAGFYFDEYQCPIVASNDVDFGVSGIGPVIPRDNGEAGASEIAVRKIFTSAAERGIGR